MAAPQGYALSPHKTMAQYVHETWNSKSGLPEADVMAILQTRDGYLWVGTEEGLARFDGVHFTVFDRKTTPLPNNRIQALAESSDASLWIGTENGLTRLLKGQFTNYGTGDGLPSANIRALWVDPEGALWITTSAGVRVWRGKGFEAAASTAQADTASPRYFLSLRKGEDLVATDSGLWISRAAAATATGSFVLRGKVIRACLQDSEGTLWIGTNVGLYRVVAGGVQSYPLQGGNTHPEVTALIEDRDRNLWVGTLGDGLMRVSQHGVLHYSVRDGLSAVEVKSLYEDRDGNLWVGTFGGGLEVFRDTPFTPFGRPEGLSQNLVWTVMEGRDQSIWIGTQAGGLDRLKDGKIAVLSTREGFTDNTVGSLFEGRGGTIWLGKDSGLSRVIMGKLAGAPAANTALHEQVHSIYEDPSGTLWIGTRTKGLVRLRDGEYTYFTAREGLAHDNVQAIVPDRDGGLWIGTLGGLSHYQNGRFTNWTTKNGLAADQVISLYEDAEGTLWIGTEGLSRLKKGRITNYSDKNGLFDQNPLAIVEDDYGYLWLSTNRGVFRVSKRQLNEVADGRAPQVTPMAFGTEDGMRSAECNGGSTPAAWKDHSGHLWFATVAGALEIDPERANAPAPPLQLHIENIWADNKYILPSGSFRLPPGVHELEFHYSAPYFAGANRIRYRYRLEGFDRGWIDAGSRTVAYYTNLPAGKYRFRVVASASGSTASEAESITEVYLAPQFYETRVFYAVVALSALGVIFLVWVWTNRFLIRRQNELKQLVNERTRELQAEKAELLEAKAALAQQASHDSLTGLFNRAEIYRVLEEQMIQAEREHTSFAVMLADLDHFKEVNDTRGHLVGDEVLREFGRRLTGNLRPYDHAGRFGGEEFLIVLPGLSLGSRERIHQLHQELCDKPFVCGAVQLPVKCSIGVAFYHSSIGDIESLLNLADQALYAAKANGRNRVEVAAQLIRPHN